MMYRAYWAIPRTLRTSAGEQVNTVFGMASMLITILDQEQPDALLICFDEGEETFRHQENATYKEGRAETPDDFYTQIPRVIELVDAFGFRKVSDAQYEADDFLGAYAKAGEQAGMRVTIVSGDRDVLQLASDRIVIAIPHKGYQAVERLGPAGVLEKFGITPTQVPAYKGLCGDASDNLPGVRGIGPKTAAELLQKYGSLGEVYAHLADIRPAVAEKLSRDRDQAFFCERMATLALDMPLPISLPEIRLDALPVAPVMELFSSLEFSLLTKRFQALLASPYGERFRADERRDAAIAPQHPPAQRDQLAMF